MSREESIKVSGQDIQLVQNLIEQCLQRYMTRKEVMNILSVQEKIDPAFTELVWQKLEQENQEFFKAYHMRLMLKEQINEFNRLLGRQYQLMHHVDPAAVSFPPVNGSHTPPMQQNSACYAPGTVRPALKTEIMQQSITTNVPKEFTNCGLSMPSCMQTSVDISAAHSRRIDVSPNIILPQSSNVGMSQGLNGEMIKTEAAYQDMSRFIYGADGNVLETRTAIGDASISSFSSVESNSQPLNETLMDGDTSWQIHQNFGLPDLPAEFSHGSDILENYSSSSFLGTDSDNFLDHNRGENQGDNRRLDTISEALSYEDFGSD